MNFFDLRTTPLPINERVDILIFNSNMNEGFLCAGEIQLHTGIFSDSYDNSFCYIKKHKDGSMNIKAGFFGELHIHKDDVIIWVLSRDYASYFIKNLKINTAKNYDILPQGDAL